MSQMNIVRVSALPAELAANTIYHLALSATELQVVVVGNTAADVRKTIVGTDVDGKLTVLSQAIAQDLSALETRAQADATAKADTAQASAQQIASIDATDKANAAQAAAITAANAYTDTKLDTTIGNMDLSNSAQYAADIAARDLLDLTKNSFVLVADATGDATVQAGAAMYFYNVGDDSFLKIAEYESQDLVIPNLGILEDLSDVGGQLHYLGAPIATVHAGTSTW